MTEPKPRPIHAAHPNGQPHPFKMSTLCGNLVRFGGIEIPEKRPVSCKKCLNILEKICPTCHGTGMKK